MANMCKEKAFISDGFKNWKKATLKFREHDNSDCHREAVERVKSLPQITKRHRRIFVRTTRRPKKREQDVLDQSIVYHQVSCQGLAFRGYKDDSDSNFVQLLKLRSSDDPRIRTWMKRTKDFTSPELQNEFLKVMSNDILRKQIKQIQQAQFFTIMADETVDSSNKEQLVICLRWVDVDFEPHEIFFGMYHIDNTEASTILNAIEDLIYLLIAYLVSVMTWQHLWLGQNLELHLVSNQLKSVQFICIVTAMHSILLVMMMQ